MTPTDPSLLHIRNQRHRPWGMVAGLMLFIMLVAELGLMFFAPRQHGLLFTRLFIATGFATAVWPLWVLLLVSDLRRDARGCPRETARTVFRWAFHRVRGKVLDPIPGETVALALFGWLVPSRITVGDLTFGDGVELAERVHYPAAAVRRIRFAPDPAEDYAEPDRALRFCEATVEMDSGRQFRMIVEEADARRLRQWAAGKNVVVADCDGYQPRPVEPPVAA